MNGLTVRLAYDTLGLAPGAVVAVSGAAGAVGGYATEVAVADGLRVIGIASPDDEPLVRGFGAEALVPRGPDAAAAIRELVPDGVDALVDAANVGGSLLPAVRDGGRIVALRAFDGEPERGITIDLISVRTYIHEQAKLQSILELAGGEACSPRASPPPTGSPRRRRLTAGSRRAARVDGSCSSPRARERPRRGARRRRRGRVARHRLRRGARPGGRSTCSSSRERSTPARSRPGAAVTVDSFGERWEVPLRADWRPERIEPAEIVDPPHEDARHDNGARRAAAGAGHGPDRRLLPERRLQGRRARRVEWPGDRRRRRRDGGRDVARARPRAAHDERPVVHRRARRQGERARRAARRAARERRPARRDDRPDPLGRVVEARARHRRRRRCRR